MEKGLSLEEFKTKLDTDAQKRCIAQEKTIKELQTALKAREDKIIEQNKLIGQLQNRCLAITRGALCLFCGCLSSCEARKKK